MSKGSQQKGLIHLPYWAPHSSYKGVFTCEILAITMLAIIFAIPLALPTPMGGVLWDLHGVL